MGQSAIQGLKLVAVAVVAHAVWGMARSLCPDRTRALIAAAGFVLLSAWNLSPLKVVAGTVLASVILGLTP